MSRSKRFVTGLLSSYAAIGVIDYPERWCADATAPMKERIRRAARQRFEGADVVAR